MAFSALRMFVRSVDAVLEKLLALAHERGLLT